MIKFSTTLSNTMLQKLFIIKAIASKETLKHNSKLEFVWQNIKYPNYFVTFLIFAYKNSLQGYKLIFCYISLQITAI